MESLSALIRRLPLTLHQQYVFASSPIDAKNLEQASEFLKYCTEFAVRSEVPVECGALVRQLAFVRFPTTEARTASSPNFKGCFRSTSEGLRTFTRFWTCTCGWRIIFRRASEKDGRLESFAKRVLELWNTD